MKAKTIGYWALTALAALAFLSGGVFDLMGSPQVQEGMTHLGYPAYFATILGAWKVAGAVAILSPKFPRLKEWAYAGMFFDLTGAAASHAFSHDPAGKILTPLVLAAIVMGSWALRPAARKTEPEAAPTGRLAPAT